MQNFVQDWKVSPQSAKLSILKKKKKVSWKYLLCYDMLQRVMSLTWEAEKYLWMNCSSLNRQLVLFHRIFNFPNSFLTSHVAQIRVQGWNNSLLGCIIECWALSEDWETWVPRLCFSCASGTLVCLVNKACHSSGQLHLNSPCIGQ